VKIALVVVPLLLVSASRTALADDPRLVEAGKRHRALDYEKCLEVLSAPPRPTATDGERAEAAVLEGVCNFELGRSARAAELFERGLRLDPRAMLPPYSSPKMVGAFEAAASAVRSESHAVPAPAPATSAPSTAPSAPPAIAPSPSAPPGQERTAAASPPLLSVVLGAGALAAGAFGAYEYVHSRELESESNRARFESDAYALGDRARGSMIVTNVVLGGALVLAGTAVIVWLATPR
jgi:hypothetical protein